MRFSFVIATVFFLFALSASVSAGLYYNPSSYGNYPATAYPLVPVYPSYHQPVNHTFDPSFALVQKYYVPYPVYVNAPSYVTYPSQTIAVTSGVSYAPPKVVVHKTVIKASHSHKDNDFDIDIDFDFPDFHDPDSHDIDDYCDKHWFC